jgi:hypothetical protein
LLQVLEKTYFMMAEDDGVLEKSEGTKIEWKPGMGSSSFAMCDTYHFPLPFEVSVD